LLFVLAFIDKEGALVLEELSPFVRVAMYSTLRAPFEIRERVIFDYELILVQGGACCLLVNGKSYRCECGDVVLFSPGVPHALKSEPGVDFVQPHIHFDAVYDAKKSPARFVSFQPLTAMEPHERELIAADVLADMKFPCIFRPSDEEAFQKHFFAVIDAFQKKERGYVLRCKAEMLSLLHLLYLQFCEEEKRGLGLGEAAMIRSYLDGNFSSLLSLDGLAAQFHLNKFTMMRLFKRSYGVNVMQYYKEKRLAYAKKLLLETKRSVAEIAEYLHFTDVYTFSRFFKNSTGKSPSVYRKR
jgi:AraC-like DNA-binding protein